MTTIASILSIASGFALMGYHEPPANMIATSIIINLALTPLTAIVAIAPRTVCASMDDCGTLAGRMGARRGHDYSGAEPNPLRRGRTLRIRLLLMLLDPRRRRREDLALGLGSRQHVEMAPAVELGE